AKALNLTFTSLTLQPGYVLATVQANIATQVRDYLRRVHKPGDTLLLSQLREAVSSAAGVKDFALSVPSGNVTHTGSELAVWGTPTWP
ncbi:MAG: baseplate J/gp47 family protein, partial [Bdellovibrionota bacterium]